MPADTLSVARDAYLEADDLAAVLDLARTMALERLARGLPVAWVETDGPVLAMPREQGWTVYWYIGDEGADVDADNMRASMEAALAILDPAALRAEWGV